MYNVVVVTGTRAEYGLLRPVLQKMQLHPAITPLLWVTGAHLAHGFGNTAAEIEQDGMPIAKKVDILAQPMPEGRAGTARRTATALRLFTDALLATTPAPDALLVLGDRYEVFAAAQAAALLGIPVVHISGGDVTFGADDDWFRHCVTKMAKLHFPSCEAYRHRVIRMGEQPASVWNVGGLGDENIRNMALLSRQQLAASLPGGRPNVPDVLVTYHPETATDTPVKAQAAALLGAVEDNPHLTYLFTAANADAGGRQLNEIFEAFCKTHPNCAMEYSLGVLRYLSAMKYAQLVLGNSSSGVVETPSFGTPAVNIGQRQTGRLTCDNVIDVPLARSDIAAAIQQALLPQFKQMAAAVKSPYNGGDTSGRIVEILAAFLTEGKLKGPKQFYDGETEK